MGLRITTWNVNGIRNPFGYQPWRDRRTFEGMFDILEADIVIMQETKIQRKDLRDDMVLIPGWDVYFSLPKHKKGYSGVAIFTRNAVCAPIRAEEGITGFLCPPNSTTSFRDLPEAQRIGGYPTEGQLSTITLDAATLDSEGRCVILEFPAFVLIGVYCPANRDESRDEYRLGFLNILDARIRNLVAEEKRVILTGDLNIIREELDTAKAEEQLRKQGLSVEDYLSTPARRMFNQLLLGGKVIGERDEGRENPVLFDICRSFHPGRKGMFTCWEQKINARPGNFGSRIDYVLCSINFKDWFCDSNIQEGLMGSDHCPVYATINEKVKVGDEMKDIKDIMNPPGIFENGIRKQEWSLKLLLPTSAKLIPEFDRRRSIRDMFSAKPSFKTEESSKSVVTDEKNDSGALTPTQSDISQVTAEDTQLQTALMAAKTVDPFKAVTLSDGGLGSAINLTSAGSPPKPTIKRVMESPAISRSKKRSRSAADVSNSSQNGLVKGQSSLKGFFKPKTVSEDAASSNKPNNGKSEKQSLSVSSSTKLGNSKEAAISPSAASTNNNLDYARNGMNNKILAQESTSNEDATVIDPIVAKESWSKLLGKRTVPRCEHNEPCVSYLTKKAGINCGRSFYMCPRPLGPSGVKEKGTQWRCGTFIWSSDWVGEGK